MSQIGLPKISKEFCEENQKKQKIPKKGGPHTKDEKIKRQDEVYRLHFEYGYSARKIAELMKVSSHTINGDISYWYSKIGKSSIIDIPYAIILTTTERLDVQRTRLREYLDKASTMQERLSIERMIYEIDCKLTLMYQRITESKSHLAKFGISCLNDYLKSNNKTERYITFGDRIRGTKKAHEKIEKILKEDRKNLWQRQN